MYANLRVTTPERKLFAWKVELSRGEILVHTDLNDGEGSYAEEGPVVSLPAGADVTITADF